MQTIIDAFVFFIVATLVIEVIFIDITGARDSITTLWFDMCRLRAWVHQTILLFAKEVNKLVYKKLGISNQSRDDSRSIKKFRNKLE